MKGINQVSARIAQLFPKAVIASRYCDVRKKQIPILKGIGILSVTRTTLDSTRTTSAPLSAPETTHYQDFRTTRTTFSNSTENIEDREMQLNILTEPMEKEEYVAPTGVSGAEPLPNKENCCGEPCVSGAEQLESGAGKSEEVEFLDNPISLLQAESEGDDINLYVGHLVEVRSLSGAVKFAGEMIGYDPTHGTITIVTKEGNRDVYLREAFVIG